VTADSGSGEFLADFLRDAIFQFRMSFEKTDKLVIYGRHSGVDFEGERVPIFDPPLQSRARERARAQFGEERRRLDLFVIGVQNNLPDALGFSFCFLGESF
jgi:hypothetical protein